MKLFLKLMLLFVTTTVQALEVKLEGNVITLSGSMNFNNEADYAKVKKQVDSFIELTRYNPTVKTVNLQNMPGGSVRLADEIADIIRLYNYDTVVSGYCYSACTRIFIMGRNRQFSDRFKIEENNIGLHGVTESDKLVKYHDAVHTRFLSVTSRLDIEILGVIPELKNNEMVYLFHPDIRNGVQICKNQPYQNKIACTPRKGNAYTNGLLTTERYFKIR